MCSVVKEVSSARFPLHLFPCVARYRSKRSILTATTSRDKSKLKSEGTIARKR